MESRVVLQGTEAKFENQKILWSLGKRNEDSDLDCAHRALAIFDFEISASTIATHVFIVLLRNFSDAFQAQKFGQMILWQF